MKRSNDLVLRYIISISQTFADLVLFFKLVSPLSG